MVASPITESIPAWAAGLVPLFEIALGLWLVSGWARFGAWVVAVPTATLLALHNLALTREGSPSCGCLGQLIVPPAVTLAFDTTILALMLLFWPVCRGWAVGPRVQAVGFAAILLGAVAIIAAERYGSIEASLAAARGESVVLTSDWLALGTVPAGGSVQKSLRVANLSCEPIDIALAQSSCNCVAVGRLPATVAPGGILELPVTVTVSTTPSPFKRGGRLVTTAGDLNYAITATVLAAAGEPGTPPDLNVREAKP